MSPPIEPSIEIQNFNTRSIKKWALFLSFGMSCLISTCSSEGLAQSLCNKLKPNQETNQILETWKAPLRKMLEGGPNRWLQVRPNLQEGVHYQRGLNGGTQQALQIFSGQPVAQSDAHLINSDFSGLNLRALPQTQNHLNSAVRIFSKPLAIRGWTKFAADSRRPHVRYSDGEIWLPAGVELENGISEIGYFFYLGQKPEKDQVFNDWQTERLLIWTQEFMSLISVLESQGVQLRWYTRGARFIKNLRKAWNQLPEDLRTMDLHDRDKLQMAMSENVESLANLYEVFEKYQ